MFGARQISSSRIAVFAVIMVFIISSLPLRFSEASGKAPSMSIRKSTSPVFFQSSGPVYDKLIQDDSSGSMLRFNSTTGEYLFSRCSDGFTLSGTGAVTSRGCTFTLTHSPTDRRVQASLDTCQKKGNASLQFPPGTTILTITDRDTSNDPGLSDSAAPQVVVTSPNKGELVDTGSSFTITWFAADNTGVTRQDISLSTDGGASFNPIVTGLAGNVNQYSWLAPLVPNNQTAKVRVTAYDAACNSSRDDSDANFTLWNSGISFTHTAEAPIYMVSEGYRSIVHLCSASSAPITVELGIRNRYGTGLVAPPVQLTLNPGQPRAIDLASYLTPQTPSTPGANNILMGSIRLRHNGSQDSDVMSVLVVDRFEEEQSFTVPFTYPATSQSSTSAMQCAPIYYIDETTSAYLALQNCANAPVSVAAKLVYGTGEAGTPNGSVDLGSIDLPPQRNFITDLSVFAGQLQGTHWGSIQLSAPSQTVAAHVVMVSNENRLAFNSAFVDPNMCVSATKVLSTLKLDYDTNLKSCLMVCNTSSAETRTVTASFQTDNGVILPSRQITLGPGQQNLIELDSRQSLSPGASAMVSARLSYSGNASDIIAGAVSMSAENNCAIPAQFIEPRISDGRRLVAPFFRFDERTSGILQLTNLGSTAVKAGAMMKFADATLPSLNTSLVTIPPGGATTLDLRAYLNLVDDSTKAQGCVEVLHNGAPGTVVGSFTALGLHNDISLQVALEGGPPFSGSAMALFPNAQELQPGDSSEVAVMTGGELSAPSWSATSTTGDPGSVVPLPPADEDVYCAMYTSPEDPQTVAVTLRADATSSGGQIEDGSITLAKVNIDSFSTDLGNGRLNPEANTGFRIIGKKDWPDTPLVVRFKGDGINTPEISVTRNASNMRELTGIAPPNNLFIGDAEIRVLQNGKKISRDKSGAAYYAFNKPAPEMLASPTGFNRAGGIITITGSGFRKFGSKKPRVNIGGIGFDTNDVNSTNTQITGLVERADASIQVCNGAPCKFTFVTNPGGRDSDEQRSTIRAYNLMPGPPPRPQARVPDLGPSIGLTPITITGSDLDFTSFVTIGGTPAIQPIIRGQSAIEVLSPPHGLGAVQILLESKDPGLSPASVPGGFTYQPTRVTEYLLDRDFFVPPPGQVYLGRWFVGPGEAVGFTGIQVPATRPPGKPMDPPCTRDVLVIIDGLTPSPPLARGPVFRVRVSYDISTCPAGVVGDITFFLTNTSAPMDQGLQRLMRVPVVKPGS
jgi:hypothetical protein